MRARNSQTPQRALSPDKNEELNLAEFQPVRNVRYACPEFDAVL